MITLANEEINGFQAKKGGEREELKRGNEALLWLTTCVTEHNPPFSPSAITSTSVLSSSVL